MLDIANNQIEHLANLKHLQNLEDLWVSIVVSMASYSRPIQ